MITTVDTVGIEGDGFFCDKHPGALAVMELGIFVDGEQLSEESNVLMCVSCAEDLQASLALHIESDLVQVQHEQDYDR